MSRVVIKPEFDLVYLSSSIHKGLAVIAGSFCPKNLEIFIVCRFAAVVVVVGVILAKIAPISPVVYRKFCAE